MTVPLDSPRVRWIIVLNTTFNNISDISWWSVLLVEETGGPRVNFIGGENMEYLGKKY
jgi:hypothetical protein